ncbi:DUF6973 domain-containing protein [uncultured Ilyobacter sp.]|uniref:DUF6973 domain-containing protein n=1 Tax=uncultured Ilyobacter sp. TaxID=544433 RepID=UPI00374A7835
MKTFGGGSAPDDGWQNAIVHCTWSCGMASIASCDCKETADLTAIHEHCGNQSQMDMVNNHRGRQCAGCSGSDADQGGGESHTRLTS